MDKIKKFLSSDRLFAVIFIGACVLSVVHITPLFNRDIINYDSAYQYCLTVQGPAEIARLIPEDYSPPLYTILLKLWTLVFGNSLFAMRSMSLLVIWGMLFLAAFPIRKAFGGKASGLCTAFFFFTSLNYMLIPEIRPTFFAYFFVTAACIYCYLAYYEDKTYAYICFTVFSICAMYTHNIGLLSAFAFYVTVLAAALIGKKFKQLKKLFISGVVCAVSYVPWLGIVFKQFGNVQTNYWSAMRSGVGEIYTNSFLSNFTDYGDNIIFMFVGAAAPIGACIFVVIGAFKMNLKNAKKFSDIDCLNFKKHKEKYSRILFCVSLYVLPFVLWTLFSYFIHPIMAVRYFYIFSGTTMMFFGVLVSLPEGKKGAVVCGLTLAVCALNFGICSVNLKNSLDKSEFIDMIEYIKDENPDGDIAFMHSHEWTLGIMMYYFPDARHYIANDTWCVLNTYDVFPAEVVNIEDFENISEYEDDLYIFGGLFPDALFSLNDILLDSGKFTTSTCFECEEPYTYQKGWELIHVESKGLS